MSNPITVDKIFILCPSRFTTGGTELLHQFAAALKSMGHQAFIVYEPNVPDPTPAAFLKYNAPFCSEVEDSPKNFLMAPEILTSALSAYHNIRKGIWWLSVDNHFFRDKKKFDFLSKKNRGIQHFSQSHYAKDFLEKRGVKNVLMLSDYLNTAFFEGKAEDDREDNVLYNPKKGIEYTQYLMKKAPHLKWTPLINMTPDQVKALMQRSKVYIDFGNHPGKDRIPREAALNGCCVVVGLRGAAQFDADVAIPSYYKIKVHSKYVFRFFYAKQAMEVIQSCLADFKKRTKEFDPYRLKISQEHERFLQEISQIFGTVKVG